MLYDGILGFDFDDVKEEKTIYTDKARRIATLSAEEANGISDGNVTAFFDLLTGQLLTINERIENDDENVLEKVLTKVDDFNNNQKTYIAIAAISDDSHYIDVNIVTIKFNCLLEDAIS